MALDICIPLTLRLYACRLFRMRLSRPSITVKGVTSALTDLSLELPRVVSGKVREMFDAGERLLMVATDRISVHDVVLPTPVPDKGAVLTGISAFWFERTRHIVGNHLVEWRRAGFPPEARGGEVRGRAMLVLPATMLPIECVVRGYLTGSGWRDYERTGGVCGQRLPEGLREAERLPEPIFTPTTKATNGHDRALDLSEARTIVGDARLFDRIMESSLELYRTAAAHAEAQGIILADTKLEFGLVGGELTLCDEAFTPDSSRYWSADEWQPGTSPPSFDKQYVRDYVDSLGWDRTPPGPELPTEVVEGTRARYRQAFERLTGQPFDDYLAEA